MRNFIPILCLSVVLSSMGHPASSSAEGTGFLPTCRFGEA